MNHHSPQSPSASSARQVTPQIATQLEQIGNSRTQSDRRTNPPPKEPRLLLRLAEVIELTAMSRGTIINKVNAREFCQPIRMGVRSIRFVKSEVIAWIEERVKERDARKGGAQ